MKILQFDIIEGFKKGGITQFENDNLNETYKIYLYKNKMRFDVDGKTIRFVMLDKNKAGQVLTLRKGEASNEIILPVTKELTKIDGVYDVQIIFTKEDGYNEKTIPFKITIKNDLLTDMEAELVSKEEYKYLVDRFDEAVRNIENFKVEIRNEYLGMETDLNNKYILFKDEVNNSNTNFKNTIDSTVNSIDEKVNSFDSRISKNTKEIDDAKGEYDTLKARLDRENEKIYETINDKDFLPFEGQNVTVEHSKVGFTKNMVVEGRTYQNLIKSKTITVLEGQVYSDTISKVDLLKGGKTYTIIYNITKAASENERCTPYFNNKIGVRVYQNTQPNYNTTIGIKKWVVTFEPDFIPTHFCWWTQKHNAAFEVKDFMILEGDYSNSYIPPYFEGIKSVGEKEGKISILSNGKNLINQDLWGRTEVVDGIKCLVGSGWMNETGSSASANPIVIPFNDTLKNGIYYLYSRNKATTHFNKFALFNTKTRKNKPFHTNNVLNQFVTTKATVNITDGEYNAIIIDTGDGTAKGYLENIYFSKIETDNFVPYQEDKKEILLPFEYGHKGFINGAKDMLEIRQDGLYAVQKVGRKVFNGTDEGTWNEASKTGTTRRFYLHPFTDKKQGLNNNLICDKLPTTLNYSDESVGIAGYNTDGRIYIKLPETVVTGTINDYLKDNNMIVYYELANPIEHKIADLNSINLETFKDVTHVFSENSIAPKLNFKAPVDVPATISTLRGRNESLEQENKELKEEADIKTLKLHGQDVELTNSDLDLDFRIFELEMSIGLPIKLNMKGMRNMARSPFEMMKILILNNNYDREDIEYKASRYLKYGRMTQGEYNEIISLMDANEVIQ